MTIGWIIVQWNKLRDQLVDDCFKVLVEIVGQISKKVFPHISFP